MKKKVISALLVGSMALSLMACGGGNKATTTESSKAAAAGDTASSGGKNVVFMPKLVGIPYFTTCNEGAQEAAKELGITCT